MRRRRLLTRAEDSDPMSVVSNLFDVAMVFAVALMENMEIITKEGEKINRYTPSDNNDSSGNKGKRVGTAYELENGDIIYVPE